MQNYNGVITIIILAQFEAQDIRHFNVELDKNTIIQEFIDHFVDILGIKSQLEIILKMDGIALNPKKTFFEYGILKGQNLELETNSEEKKTNE